MNNKISGVLFDLDGTLLDTANDLGAALNYVLRKYNLAEVARETYRPIASDGALGLLTLGFADTLKAYDYEQLRAEFLAYYQENIAVHTCLYPGVAQLLLTLDEQNIPWGIVTNKPEGLTRQLLPHYAEFEKCLSLVGGDTFANRKPHPEPILKACEEISIPSEQCLYVGDALRDIAAGNSAKASTVVAKWGYILAGEDCKSWQADYHAETPLEVLSFIR
ncbi:HAD-IA family hydrolase [Colwellia hornerae]|uniref:HAD-IA family hydrolase n=1 Tax=Colwellia hornerae TaxID=89402 RepID=A0A5C6QH37_9GAMM|nr:HAD-IA family hydrolase [Colwellia hornerae]TWX59237.1 HAD-IA family hydrolase [Colwellia hornerae]TWX68264.1 HAD-IA family hydrolase [Colwellia hornerae]